MDKIFFVYLDRTNGNRVFYVGKGQTARVKKVKRNQYWRNIKDKYGWRREVIFATKDESVAFELEMQLIYQYKTFESAWEDGGGWGCNLTAGGEGVSGRVGWKHSPETCEKMRQSKLGELNPQFGKYGSLSPSFGHTRTPPNLKELAESNRGRVHTEEARKNMSEARKGIVFTEEHKKNIGLSSKGRVASEETKKKLSEAHSGENNAAAKLNENDVRQIRELFKTENYTHREIGNMFGVSKTTVGDIIRNRIWIQVK